MDERHGREKDAAPAGDSVGSKLSPDVVKWSVLGSKGRQVTLLY